MTDHAMPAQLAVLLVSCCTTRVPCILQQLAPFLVSRTEMCAHVLPVNKSAR